MCVCACMCMRMCMRGRACLRVRLRFVRARARVRACAAARTLRVQPLAEQQPGEERAIDRVHCVDDRRLGRPHTLLPEGLQQVGGGRHRHGQVEQLPPAVAQ